VKFDVYYAKVGVLDVNVGVLDVNVGVLDVNVGVILPLIPIAKFFVLVQCFLFTDSII
jgi:uncharacterized membrane protein YbaN (DUF454 family)